MKKEELKLKDLAVDHDYYCHDNNYYSNEARINYKTFEMFYEEFEDADIDMNLVFRWDLTELGESEKYKLNLYMIKQRKGIFTPIEVELFEEKDVVLFVKYMQPHIDKLKSIWKPFEF